MEYIFVAAAAISAIIAIIKNAKKGNILEAVIKGVEASAIYVPKKDLQKVKDTIANKAELYGVDKALDKAVQLLTK